MSDITGQIESLTPEPMSIGEVVGRARGVRVGEQLNYRPVPVPGNAPAERSVEDLLAEAGRRQAVRG